MALNLSVRSEIKYQPLKLTILGDSLCAAALFIFETPKKSMLQSSIYNVSQDLMSKILQLLQKAFINLSFVSGELNSGDLNSKINKNPIKTLNSSSWRKGSALNFNTLTCHGLILFPRSADKILKLKIPTSLVKRKYCKDPIVSLFVSRTPL